MTPLLQEKMLQMSGQPKRHHYVPQFFLNRFTDTGDADGHLHAFDLNTLKTWRVQPRSLAYSTNFYKVDEGKDGDPMSVEKKLSAFESRWNAVLKELIASNSLPEGESFGDLMVFIAMMAARVPRVRNILQNFINDVQEKLNFAREFAAEKGASQAASPADPVNQTWYVEQTFVFAATMAPILSMRKWQLWTAAEGAPDLICSDSPVYVEAPFGETGGSVSVATPGSVVSLPISKRLALVSTIEASPLNRSIGGDEVARLNSGTGSRAAQVYSSGQDFVWFTGESRVGNWEDLCLRIKASGDAERLK